MSSLDFSVSRNEDVESGQLRRVRQGQHLLGDRFMLTGGDPCLVLGPFGLDKVGFRNLANASFEEE